MAAMAASSMYDPCSMESTPASAAQRIPSAPWACAATLRPRRCASATMAANSACVYCECCGSSPSESTPPVAQTFMTSAPYLMTSRTLYCTFSTPSATPISVAWNSYGSRLLSQCPPVIPSAGPLASMRGAGNIAGINGIAQGHVSESIRSHVSYRRKAGQQSDARVFGANEGLARNRDGESVVAEPGIECEVGMRVDQAGENGFARQVDDRGAGVCGCAQV